MPREFKLEIDDSVNEVFDEVPGSAFLALRKLRWNEQSKFKLDIRKWYTNSEGEEIAGKGVSFMTEDGPDNLIQALLKHGYGDTQKTIDGIKDREDFPTIAMKALAEVDPTFASSFNIPEEDSGSGTFYDPKEFFTSERKDGQYD